MKKQIVHYHSERSLTNAFCNGPNCRLITRAFSRITCKTCLLRIEREVRKARKTIDEAIEKA